jgi:hypothetical protein
MGCFLMGIIMSKWLNQIWSAGQVAKGNVVRRSLRSVMRYSSRPELENEVRSRGFHMALIGDQCVIICDKEGGINVIC